MSEPLSAEVAIIGGGLVGCATALFLARRRVPCVLLEAGRCGGQASGVNFGGVRRQGRALPELPLAERARRLWPRLGRLIGHDLEFRVTGHLRLARSEEEMAALERWAEAARPFGITVELCGALNLRARWPWLGSDLAGASFCRDDGQANPRLACPWFKRAARAAGCTLCEGQQVVGVEREGGRFRLTTADGREVVSRAVVNAAGAWGGRIAALLGDDLPCAPFAPNMGVLEPLPFRIEPVLGTAGPGLYLRQIPSGSVIFGGGRGTVEGAEWRARPSMEATLAALAELRRLVPAFARAYLIRSWAGIEGGTPDGLPIVGPSPRVPGAWHAFGFSGHGFMLAPAVGAVLAELILDGHSATSLKGLEPSRFLPQSG